MKNLLGKNHQKDCNEVNTDLLDRIAELEAFNISLQHEINEHKKLEKELKGSQERFKMIFEYAPEAYYLSDLKGTFVDGNKAAEEMIGYRKEELIGRNFLYLDLISPGDIYKAPPLLAKNLLGLSTGPDEFVLKRKDGSQVVVEVRTYPVKMQGRSLVLGIARDITERKKTEEVLKKVHGEIEQTIEQRTAELRRTNELLHREIEERKKAESELLMKALLLDNATDSIIVHDPDGNFIYLNEMICRSRGYSREELMGMNLRDLVTGENAELIKERIRKLVEEGKIVFESEHVCKNGAIIPVEVHARIIESEGRKLILSVMRDLTERKRIEQMKYENERLVYANRAKSEFLANMSHELRTPLNSIIGFSELMINKVPGDLNEKQVHFLHNIKGSGKHLLGIIDDILDISKVEAGKIELVFERISLPEAIDETLEIIRENAAKSNISIKKECDESLEFIEADRKRFIQVLLNLLINAIKFSKKEGGTITILAKKAGDMAQLSVADTGIGIRKEDMKKLFKEFEQLESGISRKYGGAGLGLAISKKLIELHGGKITVTSEFGVGTIFTFSLPLKVHTDLLQKS